MHPESTNSFRQVIFLLFSFIFCTTGIFLVIFVEKLTLLTLVGLSGEVTQVVQQFLGGAYILIGSMFYSLKDSDGRPLLITLITLNILGFIHVYLLIRFHSLIVLPVIYFTFQILMQLLSVFLLIDHSRRI
mgnify:CR=1 FL=1|tara:strand:+ start:1185 stop:1577 length:393 start_codon:yes stop_codon:yes gene_type:complete